MLRDGKYQPGCDDDDKIAERKDTYLENASDGRRTRAVQGDLEVVNQEGSRGRESRTRRRRRRRGGKLQLDSCGVVRGDWPRSGESSLPSGARPARIVGERVVLLKRVE